jgi:hypothetical protein
MGRLTLNVLLSVAQFEREVTLRAARRSRRRRVRGTGFSRGKLYAMIGNPLFIATSAARSRCRPSSTTGRTDVRPSLGGRRAGYPPALARACARVTRARDSAKFGWPAYEALHRGPGLDPRAVDREVLVG